MDKELLMNPYNEGGKHNFTKEEIEYNEYDLMAKIEYIKHHDNLEDKRYMLSKEKRQQLHYSSRRRRKNMCIIKKNSLIMKIIDILYDINMLYIAISVPI